MTRGGVRKLGLAAHVISSAGWMGAVLVYLVMAWTAVSRKHLDTTRGAYLMMEVTIWGAILPLSLASFITGVVQSFITTWGLFRHYWVVFKLALNVVATAMLLLYAQSIGYYADIAASIPSESVGRAELYNPTHLLHSVAALVLLLVATILGVFKPRGMTGYGRRRQVSDLAKP